MEASVLGQSGRAEAEVTSVVVTRVRGRIAHAR